MADGTRCTACGEVRPPDQFGRDARLKSGRRSVCKPCDRQATRDRRAGRPKPAGALVLVPKFPPPPVDQPAGGEPVAARTPVGTPAGTYSAAAERFIGALVPPAGDADALLVRSLRGLAVLLDTALVGVDEVKDANAIISSMVRVQRELAATRATKSKAAQAENARQLISLADY